MSKPLNTTERSARFCRSVIGVAALAAMLPQAWAATVSTGGQDDSRYQRIAQNPPHLNASVPPGGADAATKGFFGPVITWPSVPIHWVLTPDGRVLNFGATSTGQQGGDLDYSVWDPALGTGADAFLLLPNTTAVNTFCAAQWVLPGSGKVLLTGGTVIQPPVRGIGISDVTVFSPQTNTIDRTTSMTYRRWYATTIGTLNGEVVALGGRIDPPQITLGKLTAASTPEVFNPKTKTWRTLTGAKSDTAYGVLYNSWWYPHAWLAPDGNTFILSRDGTTYSLSTAGNGSLTKFTAATVRENAHMTSAMYAPGKIISIRDGMVVALVDINGPVPVITQGTPISRHRRFGNSTLMPNGKLFVNGGTSVDDNVLEGHHLASETWDPSTGLWMQTASAVIPRLYHSNAILLPDATVLTGGGGLPGPLTNNNGEIYYPPYLYKNDGSGDPAPRPVIDTRSIGLGWNEVFTVTVTSSLKPITRVALLGSSQATHAFNNNQRFQELPFTMVGNKLRMRTPNAKTLAPPGYYLLFAIDSDGVPSTGKMIRLLD